MTKELLLRIGADGKIYVRGEETTDKIKLGAALLEFASRYSKRPGSVAQSFINSLEKYGGE